ncbi:YncE family protein [Terriglobus aquaticus]|uniref:YncE family protein n=1 Tax=Terriglobus aquaticus TaxID=940139 RepID=A0ABW9KMM5_9BACT|nr:YncE family protein [Terriglobus aquaticus]
MAVKQKAGRLPVVAACVASTIALGGVLGCGNSYRPVVNAINPVGPSSQPEKYALALADPGNGGLGVATLIDFSGDTVVGTLNTAPVPSFLGLSTANEGYVLHQNTGLVEAFTASQITPANPTFITRNVTSTTLPAGSAPLTALALPNPGALYITETGTSRVAAFTSGAPPTIRQELPVGQNPTYVVGSNNSQRVFVLAAGTNPGVSVGTATGIENNASNAVSSTIAVGRNPVYGVVNVDGRRAFVLNKAGDAASGTSGTVSVINVQGNTLDTIPRIVVGPNPVWADVATNINELAVVNAGDGVSAGSLTVVNIPLCSASTVTTTNPACDATNPVDAAGFGSVLATIPVGINPVMVAILQDANKAYVANAGNGQPGTSTVSVIDLQRLVKTADIPIGGTLNWISATSGSPTGKVYVTASTTQIATVIRTDTDEVSATVPLQGYGVAIKVTAP